MQLSEFAPYGVHRCPQQRDIRTLWNKCDVLQGACSGWIWAKYMHLSGLDGEQKGLTFNQWYICFSLYFLVPHLNLPSNYHLEVYRHLLRQFQPLETL